MKREGGRVGPVAKQTLDPLLVLLPAVLLVVRTAGQDVVHLDRR